MPTIRHDRPSIGFAVLTIFAWIVLHGSGAVRPEQGVAQEISGLQAAVAIEKVLVDVIAQNEKSVVAVFQHRQQEGKEGLWLRPRRDPSGLRKLPDDPDFIPTRFATGVIIDRRGLVLTNYHVLDMNHRETHYVTTIERRVYHAKILATDPRGDLAVLQLERLDQVGKLGQAGRLRGTINLPAIKFGAADQLRKGNLVITLGNPYGIAQDGQASAGWGIVANLSRKAGPVPESDSVAGIGRSTLHHYGTLIQTDARLNLGTSGGPLLNLKGEMIGMTTSIAAQVGYEKSAGYAIPVDATFLRAVNILKQGREVQYGFLGIQTDNLTSAERHSGITGMRVVSVFRGSPAYDKLAPLDIVTHVNDRPIYDSNGLVLNVGRIQPQHQVRLRVLRRVPVEKFGDERFKVHQIQVQLTKFPVAGHIVALNAPLPWRGLRIDSPSAVLPIQRMGFIPEKCVAIKSVEPNSPAAKQGLQKGMLITDIDGQSVKNPDEFHHAVRGKRGPVVVVRRANDQRSVSTTLEAPSG